METHIDFIKVFELVLDRIRDEYLAHSFYLERDFVLLVQKYFWEIIKYSGLPFQVFNDYPIEEGERRSKSADLIIVEEGIYNKKSFDDVLLARVKAELAIEFKFEPSEERVDVCQHKLPAVAWSGKNSVTEDIEKINRYVNDNKTKSAVAIFVDEFWRHRGQEINRPSRWINWGDFGDDRYNVAVLWTEYRIS